MRQPLERDEFGLKRPSRSNSLSGCVIQTSGDSACGHHALADPKIEEPRRTPVPDTVDPAIQALVNDIIGKVADKWTMLILEALEEHGTLRFTQLGKAVGRISQKMLTQTVRQMEQDGLVSRTVHPVIPPHVDYTLTSLGKSLGAAFCGVWIWAETNRDEIQAAREAFAARQSLGPR